MEEISETLNMVLYQEKCRTVSRNLLFPTPTRIPKKIGDMTKMIGQDRSIHTAYQLKREREKKLLSFMCSDVIFNVQDDC